MGSPLEMPSNASIPQVFSAKDVCIAYIEVTSPGRPSQLCVKRHDRPLNLSSSTYLSKHLGNKLDPSNSRISADLGGKSFFVPGQFAVPYLGSFGIAHPTIMQTVADFVANDMIRRGCRIKIYFKPLPEYLLRSV